MGKSKHEGKSEYKRDWSKYDENVITRYELMFPFYVFQHWWELLQEAIACFGDSSNLSH
jgi:hypothetical protein